MKQSFDALNKVLVNCVKCPRLVAFRESVPVRASFQGETYWRRPVPGYGDHKAWLMISGLAPAAQGGNRTGRVLTGDLTAKFLMRALYEKGLSNQPNSDHRNDGLIMYGCYMTAVVKCVPPKDKPTLEECANCHPYLENELFLLKDVKIILALGKIAFDGYLRYARLQGYSTKGIKFGHGTKVQFPGMPLIWGCYHPSPRNTNTGKMTYEMFCQLLDEILMEKKGFEKL